MKIEDVIKSTVPMENSKKIILNIMYTQNIIAEKFNEILKPYDISGEQYNVLRILRDKKVVRQICTPYRIECWPEPATRPD